MTSSHRKQAKKLNAEPVPAVPVEGAVQPAVEPQAQPSPAEMSAFPIVGIGASAGGLAAFEAFMAGMPADVDPGMAFVLVQHLDPNHKSILAELVRRYTRMEVFEVEDGMTVRPNCVYIIPPNRDMGYLNGTLVLLEPSAPRGLRLPIDFFFRSLAQGLGDRAIGIVLSGTGSDGTLGVRAIKGEGGMVMAQDPASTQYDGMPRSAVATGLVDYERKPEQMMAQLMAYAGRAYGKSVGAVPDAESRGLSALKKVFVLVRSQTGHDFSQYKPSTIRRRIERRMAVQQIESMDGYVQFLQQVPLEVEALYREWLIGVTSFFRDPDAFAGLEQQVLPVLFAGKSAGATIRVWVPGCSTGEEAYSIAILLQEQVETLKRGFKVQVFATDIDSRAVAAARAGFYPASIAADLSPERLSRFFAAEPDGAAYRIHKGIRDLVVFSEQDVIKDPPFSRLDLISCRNLLIYMGGDLQKRLIPLFHYALNSGGMLFLGSSESIGDFNALFATFDRKRKIYLRIDDVACARPLPVSRVLATAPVVAGPVPRPAGKGAGAASSLRELTEQAIIQQVAPTAVLVSDSGDLRYIHGRTGQYLEPSPGLPEGSNILKMAREGLRHELGVALHKAVVNQTVVRCLARLAQADGAFVAVRLTVCPVAAGAGAFLYLVIMEQALADMLPDVLLDAVQRATGSGVVADGQMIAALQEELRTKEEYLQSANEELETSNEELKSSNEELQSVNEELQSSNEELETSKEELQSVNEELATVNAELQAKVLDLSRSNNDMNNLLAGTGIGTIFVDHKLCILRFTPAATQIINLIPGDVGRLVSHIQTNLIGYDRLTADLLSVLDTLQTREIEVQTRAGEWYTMRLQPYRTLENVIEGVVLTFVCITEIVRVRIAAQKATELARLAAVARDARDAVVVQDLAGRIVGWNSAAEKLYGWSEAEALGMTFQALIPESLRADAVAKVRRLSEAEVLEPFRSRRVTKAGGVVDVSAVAVPLMNELGQVCAISSVERVVASPVKREV